METELKPELYLLSVELREGGQFLCLSAFLPHLILVTSCTHIAGGGKWFEVMFIVIVLAIFFNLTV